jgi:PBP1b-binding outer membrane lipoprotein LpoB
MCVCLTATALLLTGCSDTRPADERNAADTADHEHDHDHDHEYEHEADNP